MYSSTDPIADMLTRIRNAILVRKSVISLPHSKIKESVARLLAENNFIDKVEVAKADVGKTLTLTIYGDNSNPRINEIVKISTPGRRSYVNAREIPKIKQGRGLVIISTSKGLMTGDTARKEKVGGELICKVY